MTIRTFKQLGIAFGTQSANITAKINDVIVYQGPVTTLNEPSISLPNLDFTVTNELFSWTVPDVSFTGPQKLEITIDNNAELLIADMLCNYCKVEVVPQTNPVTFTTSGENGYYGIIYTQFGDTYINNVLQTVTHNDLDGQWWWQLPPGGTFVENITIEPGFQ